jgi:hypothetical protein
VPETAQRVALETWLHANGASWLVVRDSKWARLAAPVTGLVAITGFGVRWFVGALLRSRSSLISVLPLLVVAVTLSFFSTETWQTIGSLHGLPIVLVLVLFIGLAGAFVSRQSKPDLDQLAAFADPAALAQALPDRIRMPTELAEDGWHPPRLGRAERANLLLVSVLAQVIAAAVIALAVAGFFVLLGLLSVTVAVTDSWIGHSARVLLHFRLAGHEYALTSELLRVSAFLGAFSGFYFIVSASTDQRLRESAGADHDRHLRSCLAVRAVYRRLLTPAG